ncbi:MAG: hypothetical protein K6D03_00075 [Solobacterium sp.]|nr:hypothetical protein [Solobacterium sp.]
MNMNVFLIEALVVCIVFHFIIILIVRYRPELEIYSYPPQITQRWIDLGKVPAKQVPPLSERLRKKLPAAAVIAVLLGLLVYKLNGCRSFISGFLVSYGLWTAVDWYDALIIDCLWFCHSKMCILPGTEDLTDAYHDYAFHIRESCIGMALGLPVCLLVGLAVQMISML